MTGRADGFGQYWEAGFATCPTTSAKLYGVPLLNHDLRECQALLIDSLAKSVPLRRRPVRILQHALVGSFHHDSASIHHKLESLRIACVMPGKMSLAWTM